MPRHRGAPARALAALALAAAAGCASLPQPLVRGTPGVQSWAGRFAATLDLPDGAPGDRRSTGRFALATRGPVTQLELSSPVGATLARALADQRGATLVTADGQRFEAETPEELTERAIGWRVPVRRLPEWLRGEIAHPTQRERLGDGSTRVVEGTDADWDIRIDRWGDVGPQRLTLTWPAAGAAPPAASAAPLPDRVVLRLVVDESSVPARTQP